MKDSAAPLYTTVVATTDDTSPMDDYRADWDASLSLTDPGRLNCGLHGFQRVLGSLRASCHINTRLSCLCRHNYYSFLIRITGL